MGRLVQGSHNSSSLGAMIEIGKKIQLLKPTSGDHEFINLTPFISYGHDRQVSSAYNESDVIWGNSYEKSISYSLVKSAGLKIDGKYINDSGTVYSPLLRFTVSDQMSNERGGRASPLSAPGFYYDNQGLPASKLAHSLEVAFDVSTKKNQVLRAGARTERGFGTSVNSFQLKFTERF